ncbi:MAG: hypothetical protein JO157_04300, partial [Acetobacteraceae bacterium]|nr:hypothetical protein [Acetobacteraceae bacterium]
MALLRNVLRGLDRAGPAHDRVAACRWTTPCATSPRPATSCRWRIADFRNDLRRTLADPERMAGFAHDRISPFTGAIDE